MRSFHPGPPTPGFRFHRRARSLAKDRGSCDEHDVNLITVEHEDLPGRFDVRVKDGVEFHACMDCYPGSGDDKFDGEALARDILKEWDEYKQYFESDEPPDLDSRGPKFEFRT